MISTVRAIQRNVMNWTSGEMCLRWTDAERWISSGASTLSDGQHLAQTGHFPASS